MAEIPHYVSLQGQDGKAGRGWHSRQWQRTDGRGNRLNADGRRSSTSGFLRSLPGFTSALVAVMGSDLLTIRVSSTCD